MSRLNFTFELRKDAAQSHFTMTSAKIEEVKPGRLPSVFSLADISVIVDGAHPSIDLPTRRGTVFSA